MASHTMQFGEGQAAFRAGALPACSEADPGRIAVRQPQRSGSGNALPIKKGDVRKKGAPKLRA